MSETVDELLQFLRDDARADLKLIALEHILGLSADDGGQAMLAAMPEMLLCLLRIAADGNHTSAAKQAALTLVNLSANAKGLAAVMRLRDDIDVIELCLKNILDEESVVADACTMLLSNISRSSQHMNMIIDSMDTSKTSVDALLKVLTTVNYNKKGNHLHYLGPVFSNLSQIPAIREALLNEESHNMQKLAAFTEYKDSYIRRGGIIGTIKNCCFDTAKHGWLLSDDVDLLPKLLLPLAGNEQFDDEDNDKLPLDLQYLNDDKQREKDPDIRCMLLEALTQLCALKENRTLLRDKNAYVILRELHKWEQDKKALLACENLVDILIRTEEEIAEDNLKAVDIPQDLQQKFDKMDADLEQETTESVATS